MNNDFQEDVKRNGLFSTIVQKISDIEKFIRDHRSIQHSGSLGNWPVGSIYQSTVSTSPATLFGGTWVALEGRVLVGKAAAGTFSAAGATMGAETHTLVTGEIPVHHHDYYTNFAAGAQAGTLLNFVSGTPIATTNTGGDGGHNNIQPSLVVYMWTRTA